MTEFPDRLLAGYRNFMSGRYTDERERYRVLADTGQKPHTLLVACCDSRAAPETISPSSTRKLSRVQPARTFPWSVRSPLASAIRSGAGSCGAPAHCGATSSST